MHSKRKSIVLCPTYKKARRPDILITVILIRKIAKKLVNFAGQIKGSFSKLSGRVKLFSEIRITHQYPSEGIFEILQF